MKSAHRIRSCLSEPNFIGSLFSDRTMIKNAIAFLLFLCCAQAQAFWGPMIFVPPVPNSNESVNFMITVGVCDSFASNNDEVVELVGTTIRVTKFGVSTDFSPCMFPIVTGTVRLGAFSPGTYRVELYRRQFFSPTVVDLVQTGNVTVIAGPNAVIAAPAFSPVSLLALITAVLLLGSLASTRVKP
jgi:hypothetical protein